MFRFENVMQKETRQEACQDLLSSQLVHETDK